MGHHQGMAAVVVLVLYLFVIALIVRAVLSWIAVAPDSGLRPVVDGVVAVTEPVLAPVRRVIPPVGGLDLSVLLVILLINLVLIPLAQQLP